MIDETKVDPFDKVKMKEMALSNLKKAKANEKAKLDNGAKYIRIDSRTLKLEK